MSKAKGDKKAKTHLSRLANAPAVGADAVRFAEVLASRARRLAAPRDNRSLQPVGAEVLCFTIAGESYGLPLADLAEVFPLAAVMPVPGVPQHLLGVTNVRGEIRPVLNLHAMLSLPEPEGGGGYVVFLRAGTREVGLRVDGLDRIRLIDTEALTRPSLSANGLPQRFVGGITADTLVLLDTRQIFGLDVLQERRTASLASP